ncbi:MAG: ATP-binding protein [Myxococcales bacterium]|nr:ATP-binding protein [Myxococcales bacterium]
MRQQQRLEALGSLASGVAHEINNPIQSIMNYAQLIRNRADSEPLGEYAGEILFEAQRVATIVRNLLSFARQEGEPYTEASVGQLVEQTLALTAAALRKEQIDIEVQIPEDLPDVPCHPQQIQQVVMNLITYGRDALNARFPAGDPEKRIVIRSELHAQGGEKFVRTVIEDNGIGMDKEVAERVFDPFDGNTDNRGSAFGLAVSQAIVSGHGGRLTISSEPGEHTRFHLDLPLEPQVPTVPPVGSGA